MSRPYEQRLHAQRAREDNLGALSRYLATDKTLGENFRSDERVERRRLKNALRWAAEEREAKEREAQRQEIEMEIIAEERRVREKERRKREREAAERKKQLEAERTKYQALREEQIAAAAGGGVGVGGDSSSNSSLCPGMGAVASSFPAGPQQ